MTAPSRLPNTDDEAQAFGLVLGQVVAQLRQSAGLNQEELAGKAGISQSAVSKIESGKRPDAFVYGRLAAALKLSVDQLEQRVKEAMKRTQAAAKAATQTKARSMSWGELLAVAGFLGLIVFAVAAVLEDSSAGAVPKVPAPK